MTTVPNAENSIVDLAKVSDYMLSAVHPIGRAKAAFFLRFGFRANDPAELAQALLRHVRQNSVGDREASKYGTKYRVDGPLSSPEGRNPHVSSIWMVRAGETIPRLVTAFPC